MDIQIVDTAHTPPLRLHMRCKHAQHAHVTNDNCTSCKSTYESSQTNVLRRESTTVGWFDLVVLEKWLKVRALQILLSTCQLHRTYSIVQDNKLIWSQKLSGSLVVYNIFLHIHIHMLDQQRTFNMLLSVKPPDMWESSIRILATSVGWAEELVSCSLTHIAVPG